MIDRAKKLKRIVKNAGRKSKETFDEFLEKRGLLAEAEELAVKELIAEQLAEAMERQGITKIAMARRMKTSRRQLDRLLDKTGSSSVTLSTLHRAAVAVGRKIRVELA
jgi:antitoxin HicB